ncbi:MAG: phosphatase PAP2 family protein [Pseudomonadota bacterium]
MIAKISKWIAIAALIAIFLPGAAMAKEPEELRLNWKIDLAATSIAASGWIITMAAMGQMAPAGCRWCDVNAFDKWGHDNIRWSNTGSANRAVHITGFALAPLAAFGLDAFAAHQSGNISNFLTDALIIAEASTLAAFTGQIVKIASGRQRPYAHFGGGSQSPSDNISFYSGHTTLAFALAVSSGTVASMRGYSLAPWIWGAGLGIAATTGYLSIASDRHYLTDVIAGAAIGSAFGFGIPYLFHRPRARNPKTPLVSVQPAHGGGLITIAGMW